MQKKILITGQISLLLVFLVMLAGSVVRMTGSGMGCPDWPKCFGYYIPPTDEAQLTWTPNHKYLHGQMIISNESLLVAGSDFISDEEMNPENWRVYDKHDYAIFNPTHTWIEYINRLFGALSGIPVAVLLVLSLFHVRKDPTNFVLSLLAMAALGYVAWLGKLVVDGHLIPHSITYHMFGALAVMFLIIAVIHRNRRTRMIGIQPSSLLRVLGIIVLLFSLVQIFLGTGVREEVDAIGSAFERTQWIDQLGSLFLFHRSFSIAVVAINAWFIYSLLKIGWPLKWPMVLIGFISLEIIAGVVMNYAGFPALMQPVHLLSAIFIGAVQFYLCLQLWFGTSRELVAG